MLQREGRKMEPEIQELQQYKDYIGVFDSGVGGISVLRELVRELPEEDFYFFGDSANAPYGEKTIGQVRDLSLAVASRMAGCGVKAIVIACNTATSAAVRKIRELYSERIPIIGIEPALKPAAERIDNRRILVMATSVTLKLDKYGELSRRLEKQAEFLPLECSGLAARIEKGNLGGEDLKELLEKLLNPFKGRVDGIVLGCTHYPFAAKQISEIMGGIPLYDGAGGTARELHRQLERRGLLKKEPGGTGRVILESSLKTPEMHDVYEELCRTAFADLPAEKTFHVL